MSDNTPRDPAFLSADRVAELEQLLVMTPDNEAVRGLLLRHYKADRSPRAIEARVRHLLRVIRSYPEEILAGGPAAPSSPIPADRPWGPLFRTYPHRSKILIHAARSFLYAPDADLPQVREWIRRVEKLDPGNPDWPRLLAMSVDLERLRTEG